jgi:drug/metabolite transporter (DMT)-like permease
MGPLFVALWLRFGEHQQVTSRLWFGLSLCLAGLACVAQIWTGSLSLDAVGVLAGLTCAVLLGTYYVLGSRSVSDRDPLSVTCWAFGFAAIAGSIVRPWWSFPGRLLAGRSHGVPMWLLATYMIVFGSVVAYLLVSAAFRHLPPTSVGILGMGEPVVASLFAWALLGEVLTVPQIIGGLVVLVGVVLAETARARLGPHPAPTPADRPHPAVADPAPAGPARRP